MREYSLKQQAAYLTLGKFISLFFTFLTPIVLVRIFSKSDYGFYQKIITVSMLSIPYLRLSLGNSMYYFYTEKNIYNNKIFISQTYFIPFFISTLFCSLILINNSFFINNFDFIINKNFLLAFVLLVFFTLNSQFLDHIFIIEGKANYSLLYFSFDKMIRALLVIFSAFFYESIYSVLVALIFYFLFKSLFLFIYLLKKYFISLKIIKTGTIIQQFQYTIPLYLSSIVGKTGIYIDKILVMSFLSSSDFAIYIIGNFQLPFITMFYTSIGNVIMPKLSEYSKKNEYKKAHSLWVKMIKKNSLVTIPTVIYFIIISPVIIPFIFSYQYKESIIIFQICLLVLLVQMLGYGYILRAFAKTKSILYSNTIKLILSLITGYILIIYFGLVGAAILFVFTFMINAVIQLIKTRKILNVSVVNFLPWVDFFYLIVVSCISAGLVLFIKEFIIQPFLFLILSSLMFYSVVLLILLKFNYLKFSDILSDFKQIINK